METKEFFWSNSHRVRKYLLGIIVMIAGFLLIGFNVGFLPPQLKPYLFSWQMLLIAIGVANLLSGFKWFSGVILIGVGTFFLVPEDAQLRNYLIPVFLIILGLLIIFRKRHYYHDWHHHKWHHRRWDHYKWEGNTGTVNTETGMIDESNVFSHNKMILSPGIFKGGRIENVFGGSEIDLTQTELAEGKNILEIDCVFGGISLIVPSDWKINLNVKAVFGGFEDKRRTIKTNGDSNKELIITGSAVFGGGEIKTL